MESGTHFSNYVLEDLRQPLGERGAERLVEYEYRLRELLNARRRDGLREELAGELDKAIWIFIRCKQQ